MDSYCCFWECACLLHFFLVAFWGVSFREWISGEISLSSFSSSRKGSHTIMSQYYVPQSNTTQTYTPQSYTQQQVSYVQQQTTVPQSKMLQTYTPQSFMPQQSYVPQNNTSIYMPQQVQSFSRECAPSSTFSCFHPSFLRGESKTKLVKRSTSQ